MPFQEITAERPPPPSGERTSSARDGGSHTAQARASPLMSCGPCRDVHQGQERLAALLLLTRTHQTPPPTILLPRSEPSRTVHARIVLQELVKRFLVLLDLSFHRFFLSCLILAASASSNSARDVVAAWSCSFAKILRKGKPLANVRPPVLKSRRAAFWNMFPLRAHRLSATTVVFHSVGVNGLSTGQLLMS